MLRTATTIAAILALATPGAAQETETGGALFFYQPHDGQRPAFEEGYRAHLDWHRQNADSLNWFAWDVLFGPDIGQFVDGVFGVPFAALDARVDPRGDAQDAARNIAPYADPTARQLLQLRSDLSTSMALESGASSRFVHAVRYFTATGHENRLAAALTSLREEAEDGSLLPYTVYEHVAGTDAPGFLMLVWLDSWSDLDDPRANPDRTLRQRVADERSAIPGLRVQSQIWRYRPTLTYFGDEQE